MTPEEYLAKARLTSSGIEISSRKHRALLGQFSKHIIAQAKLPRRLGRALNEAQKLRHFADYEAPGVARIDAEQALADACSSMQSSG